MNSIRLGMIGAGQIAGFTAREFIAHPACSVVAVADPSRERAQALAERVNAASVYESAEALIEQTDIDAVYVAVPNAYHQSVATLALESGRHVLLDKPFAPSAAAAEAVVQSARNSGATLMLGMNHRFERNVQRARRLVEQDRFGEIYHVKAFWRRRSGIPRLGSWFTSRSVAGGGALLDIGVHALDVALHLMKNFDPVSVSGVTFTRFGNRGLGEGGWGRSEREHDHFDVDDFATALIRFDNGAAVSLDAAWAGHQESGNDHDVLIYGEDAGMAVYADRVYQPAANGEYHVIQNADTPPIEYPHCSRAQHFINVLLGEEQPIIDHREALAVQRILDGIYESAVTGREVSL